MFRLQTLVIHRLVELIPFAKNATGTVLVHVSLAILAMHTSDVALNV